MSRTTRRVHTILCVDDEAAVLSALRRVFLHEDVDVLLAEGAEAGLELVRKHEIDLILSDFRMPGVNGLDFLRQVMDIRPECVRMILSAHADLDAVNEALKRGQIYRFLQKPWDNQELRDTVRAALDRRAAQADR